MTKKRLLQAIKEERYWQLLILRTVKDLNSKNVINGLREIYGSSVSYIRSLEDKLSSCG